MNNLSQQPVPERLIQSTLEFLKQMSDLDRLIQTRGYEFVLSMYGENTARA